MGTQMDFWVGEKMGREMDFWVGEKMLQRDP
jgi:hypothetical protein